MKTVYGPVPSWRLLRSIGVDLISQENKVCPFDCTYCQLGKTKEKTIDRAVFVETGKIGCDLSPVLEKSNANVDIVTFSGTGEPTLALNLGEAIDAVRGLTALPIAILTNASLMYLEEVRISLAKFDRVVAKLDAPNEELFQKINRPASELSYRKIVEGIKSFREIFNGKLALQVMFMDDNMKYADDLARLALKIGPDEVHINTPTRPCQVQPLNPAQIEDITKVFEERGLKTKSVYKKVGPVIEPVDMEETLRRRPVI